MFYKNTFKKCLKYAYKLYKRIFFLYTFVKFCKKNAFCFVVAH